MTKKNLEETLAVSVSYRKSFEKYFEGVDHSFAVFLDSVGRKLGAGQQAHALQRQVA